MTSAPPPIDQPHKRSGSRTVLYVLLGIAGLGLLTCGAGALWLSTSEQGKKLTAGAQAAVELGEKGQNGPGTVALRAAGCDTAVVLQFGDMAELMGAMLDEEELAAMYEDVPADTFFVTCNVGIGSDAPTCPEIAGVFSGSVSPGSSFNVQVSKAIGSCQGFFTADGEAIEEG